MFCTGDCDCTFVCVLFCIVSAFNDDFVCAQSVLNRLSVCRMSSNAAATAKIPFDIIVVVVVVVFDLALDLALAAARNAPYVVLSFQRLCKLNRKHLL